MPAAVYGLRTLPDLSLVKYQSLADSGVAGVLKRHATFLRQWHGICLELSLSLHLLYAYLPENPVGNRLKVFLVLQGEEDSLRVAHPFIFQTALSELYDLARAELPRVSFGAGATLTKTEKVESIYHRLSEKNRKVHLVPSWEPNEDARLLEMVKTLQTIGRLQNGGPCAYRADFYPCGDAAQAKEKLEPIIKVLRGDYDVSLSDDLRIFQREDAASRACDVMENWISDTNSSPFFRVNVYAFASSLYLAKMILNSAGAEAALKGGYQISPIKEELDKGYRCTSRLAGGPRSYCVNSLHAVLESWSTSYSLEEAASFFKLPVLYDGEEIDLPKETTLGRDKGDVRLGLDLFGRGVEIPLTQLTKHAFFTGMPGSGKTNTMLHLANELHRMGIPFLVIEPAKKEYRAMLASSGMRDVCLFSPHVQSAFPLLVNPFEFPVGVRVSEHISALLEVFEGSFVLEGPTHKFLSSSIQKAYEDKGWSIEDQRTGSDDHGFPSMRDVYANIEDEVECSSYDAEIKGNVRSFLQVRLGSLMERDAGELFGAVVSTIDPGDWIRQSAIVELEVLPNQTKSFFILLVCHYILETLRAKPNADETMSVRHALFIEEAHNVIASQSQQSSTEAVDPKVSATAYLVKMLAEVRALREAMIISDQLPTALATEVTKNTGLKVVHRLASNDDREVVGGAISASDLQMEQMNSLRVGEAFVHFEGILKPFRATIFHWKSPTALFDVNDDIALAKKKRGKAYARSLGLALNGWIERELVPLCEELESLERAVSMEGDKRLRSLSLTEARFGFDAKVGRLRHRLEARCALLELIEADTSEVVSLARGYMTTLEEREKLLFGQEE